MHSFLEDIYNSVAETLPDVRDETLDSDAHIDPYAIAMSDQNLRPQKQAKKNQTYRSVQISPEAAQKEARHLPPGTMKEYYDQFLLQAAEKVSFKTFWLESRMSNFWKGFA